MPRKHTEESSDNIWKYSSDVACNSFSNKSKKKKETFVLYVGDKGSGKTSLINQFLGNISTNSNDIVRPTIGLDYHYATRKSSNKTSYPGDEVDYESKEMVHIWELGSGPIDEGLIAAPIRHRIHKSIVIVIVLDLSMPCNVFPSLSKWLSVVKKVILKLHQEEGNKDRSITGKHSPNMKQQCHADAFPVPLMIVANKHDLFKIQDSSSSKLKRLIQALRIAAYINGAHLIVGSINEKSAKEMYRTLSRQVLFSKKSQQTAVKHEKADQFKQEPKIVSSVEPFYISAGEDSLEKIFSSLPCGFSDIDMAMLFNQSSVASMAKITTVFESLFGSYIDANNEEYEIDSKKNDYPENTIDKAKEASRLRLKYYVQEKELK